MLVGALRAAVLAATFGLLTAASSPRAPVASHDEASPAVGHIRVQPGFSGPLHARPGSDAFSCESNPIGGSAGPRCYTPQQIQEAYGYSGLLASGVNGNGVTIVIIDAYSNPYVANDLEIQDSTFGLPAASFQAVAPQGVPAFDAGNSAMAGWAEEITLDVLWAHAMAPAAKIVLVEARSGQDADILAATKWAVDNDAGNVISQSFGESELCVDSSLLAQQHAVFQEAVDKGRTLFASSGDSGASTADCNHVSGLFSVSSPASDPLVTAVGGTTLSASDPTGAYLGETAWTNASGCNAPDSSGVGCSGGGYSLLYSRPDYQQTLVTGNTGRGVPDVSYNAGIDGGVLTHCGICNVLAGYSASDPSLFVLFGGTSAGSPQWAALTADAEQMAGHPLGDINPVLYGLAADPARYAAAFHDVTTGDNRVPIFRDEGYDAVAGWDPVTGLGSPNAASLLPVLQGPPTSTSAPVVSGVAAVGHVLTTTKGTWNGSPTSYAYQWQRCSATGSDCTDIPGTPGYSYRLVPADAGHVVRSEVVAGNQAGPSTPAASSPTAVVIALPTATARPVVSGKAVVGRKLRTTNGTWSASPARFAYTWLRCAPRGDRCRRIAHARRSSYRLALADSGHTIRTRVSATNAAGTTTVVSTHSDVVIGRPAVRKKPRIAGRPRVGRRLRARSGIWRGPPSRYRYQWLRCDVRGRSCTRIAGARYVRYRVRSADVGHRLRVRVLALNVAGKRAALSRPSRVVA